MSVIRGGICGALKNGGIINRCINAGLVHVSTEGGTGGGLAGKVLDQASNIKNSLNYGNVIEPVRSGVAYGIAKYDHENASGHPNNNNVWTKKGKPNYSWCARFAKDTCRFDPADIEGIAERMAFGIVGEGSDRWVSVNWYIPYANKVENF